MWDHSKAIKLPATVPCGRKMNQRENELGLVVLCSLIFLTSMLALGAEGVSQAPLQLRSATANRPLVPRFGTLELVLDLSASYSNAFDPDEIDVHGIFISPNNKEFRVNGFLYQPFSRRLDGDTEKLEPAGEPVWKIRFTPDITGDWRYILTAKDRTGSATLPKAGFRVTESQNRGFIRRSANNPRIFLWDDGRPFFPVGENLCWGGKRGSFDYDTWLPQLAAAGGNFIRLWMSSWNCALEWSAKERGDWRAGSYHGAGNYSLDNAWKLDTIFDAAAAKGINLMLCLGTYGEFNEGGYFGEGQWKANPYNRDNGGPCAKPADFWADPVARRLYQQRLRYLVARYADRTNLAAWEFWNEAQAPALWVAEMARYLKGTAQSAGPTLDPYAHLVSTTYGNDEVWKLPEIDFTQTHSYGTGNIADHAVVVREESRKHAKFAKPHLMAEFGIDWRSPDAKYDPESKGINFHNALWSSLVSGDAGTAMIWWWDNYIHPKGLVGQFSAVRRFVDAVPWNRGEWRELKVQASCQGEGTPGSGTVERPAPKPIVYGISDGRTALAWLLNPAHNWKNIYEKRPVPVLTGISVTLQEFPFGSYRAEWWDTRTGEIVKREEMKCADGNLNLALKELPEDIALRIERVDIR